MQSGACWLFAEFQLDPTNEELRSGETKLALRPKLFALLLYLIEHAGRLVTHDELALAIWPRTRLSDSVLRGCIRDLRELLGDAAAQPRFIETVPHRGYRFLAEVRRDAVEPAAGSLAAPGAHTIVGRDADLQRLEAALARAMQGRRQLVFVTGEPGIGKTTLVDAFVSPLENDAEVLVSRGQCVEQYGAGEAYLPMLEALVRLGRHRRGPVVIALLHRVQGLGRERMLREMAEALEALAAHAPLVLLLEDLHWSDHSTIELLGMLARRREAARLLIIGTYRPVDAMAAGRPVHGLKVD